MFHTLGRAGASELTHRRARQAFASGPVHIAVPTSVLLCAQERGVIGGGRHRREGYDMGVTPVMLSAGRSSARYYGDGLRVTTPAARRVGRRQWAAHGHGVIRPAFIWVETLHAAENGDAFR